MTDDARGTPPLDEARLQGRLDAPSFALAVLLLEFVRQGAHPHVLLESARESLDEQADREDDEARAAAFRSMAGELSKIRHWDSPLWSLVEPLRAQTRRGRADAGYATRRLTTGVQLWYRGVRVGGFQRPHGRGHHYVLGTFASRADGAARVLERHGFERRERPAGHHRWILPPDERGAFDSAVEEIVGEAVPPHWRDGTA